jgi:hypothetical protein
VKKGTGIGVILAAVALEFTGNGFAIAARNVPVCSGPFVSGVGTSCGVGAIAPAITSPSGTLCSGYVPVFIAGQANPTYYQCVWNATISTLTQQPSGYCSDTNYAVSPFLKSECDPNTA